MIIWNAGQILRFGKCPINYPGQLALWIDTNQLGRRNLSPDVVSLLRGRIYNRTKKAHGGARDQSDHLKTSESLATAYGVGEATIRRDGQFARAVEVVKEACWPDYHHRSLFLDNELYRIAQLLLSHHEPPG